jgi:hypothetical protein
LTVDTIYVLFTAAEAYSSRRLPSAEPTAHPPPPIRDDVATATVT